MTFKIDLTKSSTDNLLALINFDNADTIDNPLTTAEVQIAQEEALAPAHESGRGYRVQLQSKKHADDVLDIFFNKLLLDNHVSLTINDGDFDYLEAGGWVDGVSEEHAVTALRAALTRHGFVPNAPIENLTAARVVIDEVTYLRYSFKSQVFVEEFIEQLPEWIGDIIPEQDLMGFDFTAIPKIA